MPATPFNIAAFIIEGLLLLSGVVLLWRQTLSRSVRAAGSPVVRLPAWNVSPQDFLLYLFLVIAGSLIAQLVGSLIIGSLHLSLDARLILLTASLQFGLLVSAALLPLHIGSFPSQPSLLLRAVRNGFVTFLITLSVVTAVNLLWSLLMGALGIPAEEQEILRLFKTAESPALRIVLIVFATLIAPVSEEVLFRGMLFRYLRTRTPRWVALLVPGAIFASLHVSWRTLEGLPSFLPLVTLAVILSIAYERTGRISTVIVAHGLFNAHTILLLVTGVAS